MTYYYRSRTGTEVHELADDYYDFLNGKTPHKLFVEENNLPHWWHRNRAGKIDMNINMADKDIRKNYALARILENS